MASSKKSTKIRLVTTAKLPTEFGVFKLYAFESLPDHREQLAIVRGTISGKSNVLTRVHSACLTGDALGSLRCDCRPQLALALKRIAKRGGVVLYLGQEGRGIGLMGKLRAYHEQDKGLDTFEANVKLGFPPDSRTYDVAAAMLKELGIKSIALMTNNPDKILQLTALGVEITKRVPHVVPSNIYNRRYIETKRTRFGHLLHHVDAKKKK